MFKSRLDRISNLIDLYKRLEPTKIDDLLFDSIPIATELQSVRETFKNEIESFTSFIIDGVLDVSQTIDIEFVEKVIEYNPHFVGNELAKTIEKYYPTIGFENLFKMISNIKNIITTFYCFEVLYLKIIFDGENHRTEACHLKDKLDEMSASEDFQQLSEDQQSNVTNMLDRLKPHARPIVKKSFYHKDLPIPIPKGEENGVSYPVFSRTGNCAEHHLLMGVFMNQFDEKQQKMKKFLKK